MAVWFIHSITPDHHAKTPPVLRILAVRYIGGLEAKLAVWRPFFMKKLPKNLKKELIFTKDPSGATIVTVDVSKHLKELKEASLTRTRNRQLQKKYGLSLDNYNELFIQQGGKCAICGKLQSEFNYPFHVDHDHLTGQVRGLLCAGCNTGLGQFEKLHKEMQNYLAKNRGSEYNTYNI